MIRYQSFKGYLKFGQHKSIHVQVQLEIDKIEAYESEPDPSINQDQYIDGLRIKGEFSFESPPIQLEYGKKKHPVYDGAIGELTIYDQDESTKMNVLVMENTATEDVIEGKLKKYFWLFVPIGKPAWDKLSIFPEDYRGTKMNRVYFCTDFRGDWPVEVSSVIVAADKREAKRLLDQRLKELDIPLEGDGNYTFTEIDTQIKGATIIEDGKDGYWK